LHTDDLVGQPPGDQILRQAAAILFSRGQGRRGDGGTLCPCQPVQATSAAVAYPLRSRLGRIIRDIRRKIEGQPALEEAFALPLGRATQIRSQQQRQRGFKLYFFHAPEVECIGKGNAAAPYEFGVKASIVTNNRRAPGGLFVLHARALPDNRYDGHTLRDFIDRTVTLTSCPIERAYVDKGYRGHDAQNPRRVFISAANIVLSAVDHNFGRILVWLRFLAPCPHLGSPGKARDAIHGHPFAPDSGHAIASPP
jgi:transposase, IS5 family